MVLLTLLIACPSPPHDSADDSGLDSEDSGDSGDTGFPDLPRDTGIEGLAEQDWLEGEAQDGLGSLQPVGELLWAGLPQRGSGRGAACLVEDGLLSETCWTGLHAEAYAGNALMAYEEQLVVASFWSGTGDGAVFIVGEGGGQLSGAETSFQGTEGSFAGISLGQGDIDDDGRVELGIGAFAANTSAFDGGAVWLVEPEDAGSMDSQAGVYGTTDQGWLGIDHAFGDVDGDGVDDLLAGAFGEDNGSGAAYLFLGPLDGIVSDADADARMSGGDNWTYAGKKLDVGDVDGDGHADMAIAATDAALVSLVMGPGFSGELSEAEATVTGAEGSRLGFSTALTDLEGDRRADLLLGATRADEAGAAYVFYGPVSGHLSTEEADWTLTGEAAGDKAGSWVEAFEGQLYVAAPDAIEGAGRVYLP